MLVRLRNHFNGNTTFVFKHDYITYVINGCQFFDHTKLTAVCRMHDVPDQYHISLIEAVDSVTDPITMDDIDEEFMCELTSHSAFHGDKLKMFDMLINLINQLEARGTNADMQHVVNLYLVIGYVESDIYHGHNNISDDWTISAKLATWISTTHDVQIESHIDIVLWLWQLVFKHEGTKQNLQHNDPMQWMMIARYLELDLELEQVSQILMSNIPKFIHELDLETLVQLYRIGDAKVKDEILQHRVWPRSTKWAIDWEALEGISDTDIVRLLRAIS